MNDQKIMEEIMMNNVAGLKRQKLVQAVEESYDQLLTSIRVLIWKLGMAGNRDEANELSYEILNETVATAINIEARFDIHKSMHAWLMSIATNKIRELKTKEARRGKRMGNVTETYHNRLERSKYAPNGHRSSENITEDEMIDYLNTYDGSRNPLHDKIHLSFAELISLVGPEDQQVLKLAFEDNLRGNDLAASLKISVGTANVRLSRAVTRLRQAYLASEASERSKNE